MEVGRTVVSAAIEDWRMLALKDRVQVGNEQRVFSLSAAVGAQGTTAVVGVRMVTVVERVCYGLMEGLCLLLGKNSLAWYGEIDTDSEDWHYPPSKPLK